MDIADQIRICLKEQLKTTPFDGITISSLCSKAGISRRTFGRHFSGIGDIVDAQIREDFVEPVRQLRNLLPMEEIKSSPILLIERMFQTFYENRDYYSKLLHYRGNMSLVEAITREISILNREIYSTYDMTPEDRDFAVYLFASTQAMIFVWWIREKEDIPPKQMAKLYHSWCFGHWSEILNLDYD